MRVLSVLVALLLPVAANAEVPRWAQVVFTVGGSLAGETVGAPLGVLAYGAVDPYNAGRCGTLSQCEMAGLHFMAMGAPIGMALGGAGGAIGANAIAGGNVRKVAVASGTTALVSSALVLSTPAVESLVPYAAGVSGALIGVPTAAGIAAGSNPARNDVETTAAAPTLGVSASYTRGFKGVRISGKW